MSHQQVTIGDTSLESIVAAVRRVHAGTGEKSAGFTTAEYAVAAGIPVTRAMVHLRRLFEAEQLRCVGKRSVMTRAGYAKSQPCYALVKKR